MKSRLSQLVKGNTEYRKPVLSFVQPSLSGTVLPGKRMTTEIGIVSENNIPMHLFFFSKNPRVRVSQPLQIGKTGKFSVEVNTIGLQPGARIEGAVDVIYNGGETALPYDFTVGLIRESGTLRSFETLDEFVAFASSDYAEASRLFSWKEFLDMPFMHDLHLVGLYHTFTSNTKRDGGLREFLRAAGYDFEEKKQTEIRIQASDELLAEKRNSKDSLKARKNYRVLEAFLAGEMAGRSLRENTKTGASGLFKELCEDYPSDTLVRLLYVYFLVSEGDRKTAKEELILLQDPVQKERMEKKDIYCFFLFLASTVQDDTERLEQARKLCHRYYMDGVRTPLMFELEYRMNPEIPADHTKAFTHLFQFNNMYPGHPLLYLEAAELFNENTEDIHVLSEFELRTMLFGLRMEMFTEKKLFELLSHELKNPKLLPIYMLVLKLGYRRFGNIELLQAITNVYLQQKLLGQKYVGWYREAVHRGVSLSGLYEYYIASLPKDYDGPLEREVVRYFGLGSREASGIPLDLLYSRVTTEYEEDEEIQELYREKVEAYALKKLKAEEYTVRLIPVLRRVMTADKLDETTAPGMLEAFYLHHLHTALPDVRRVIIHYPQLRQEASYPLQGSEALVPLFSTEAVIAFEDGGGNRYFDPELTMTPVYSDDALKKQCMLYVNDTLLVQLGEADEIIRQGALKEQDLFIVTDLIKNKRIDDFYRARLYETLIDLSLTPDMTRVDCSEFLLEADYTSFTPAYQARFLKSLIDREYYKEAYRRVLEYGCEGLSDDSLLKLSENIMDEPLAQGDRTLLYICSRLFENGLAGAKICEFLAKYFEGNTKDLMAVLRALRKKRLPAYELLEKTFIQCFYVDDDRNLDQLFDWYLNENRRNQELVYAYLILRSHQYFTGKKRLTENAAEELMKNVLNLPKCCMLAAFRYYAETKQELLKEDHALLSALFERAVNEDIVLGAFTELSKKTTLPPELQGRVFLEYRSETADNVAIVGTVFPGRKFFHRTLKSVYPGVFSKAVVLYEGEWLQFYYSVHHPDDTLTEEEAEIMARDSGTGRRGSRYDEIERLQKRAEGKDLRETAELLKSMLLRDAMIEDIFKEI